MTVTAIYNERHRAFIWTNVDFECKPVNDNPYSWSEAFARAHEELSKLPPTIDYEA